MTAVSVDPRLRARRVAVQRDVGRRRLRRLVVISSVVMFAVAGYMLARSPLLDVDEVAYVGLDQTPLDAALAAAEIESGQTLLWLDAASAATRLERLPWVAQAHVSRSWTGRVTVEIVEREAVASVMTAQDNWVLVDASGRVLTGVVSPSQDLPKISGVRAAGEPGSSLGFDSAAPLNIAELLPRVLFGRVDGIYRDELGELWIALKSADRVLFGAESDLALKVVSMTTVLEELDGRGQTGWELDVSVPTLPVVRPLRDEWRPRPAS